MNNTACLIKELKEIRNKAEGIFYEGRGGMEVVRSHSDLMDSLLIALFKSMDKGVSLLALGGYGRRELAPFSDIDLMFLYRKDITPSIESASSNVLYSLWDAGLQVSHSLRSFKDCLREARIDLRTKTSLLEARFIAGDDGLYNDFIADVINPIRSRKQESFLREKLSERLMRYKEQGDSPYLIEPNVKEGEGGLRDIHLSLWLSKVVLKIKDIEGLKDILKDRDYKRLIRAYDFMLRIRVGLHILAKRKNDVLSFPYQEGLAPLLGFKETGSFSAPERLMRRYHLMVMDVTEITKSVINLCAKAFVKRPRWGRKKLISSDSFILFDGYITAGYRENFFMDKPERMIEAYELSAKYKAPLSPYLKDGIRENLRLVNDSFRRSESASLHFISLLESDNPYEALKEMHEIGLLGRYIPEFGAIRALVVYDPYHQYTVDEHTLMAIKNLGRLNEDGHENHKILKRIFLNLNKRWPIYLALLLHDTGKAKGSMHEKEGTTNIGAVMQRLSIKGSEAAEIEFIVRNHLLMSRIAQKMETEDPEVIEDFADVVKREEYINALYLITYADVSSVRQGFWSDWKAFLFNDLYLRTIQYMRGEFEDKIERLYSILNSYPDITRQDIVSHLDNMPDRYLHFNSEDVILSDIKALRIAKQRGLFFSVSEKQTKGAAEITVVALDRAGLFFRITGAISSKGLNILKGQVFTGNDGVIIDRFYVSNWETLWWEGLSQALGNAIEDAVLRDLEFSFDRRPSAIGARVSPVVEFDNETSEDFTILELLCRDRVGLLYIVSRLFFEQGISIASAKINTEAGVALDVFYLQRLYPERAPRKVTGFQGHRGGLKLDGNDAYALIFKLWELLRD